MKTVVLFDIDSTLTPPRLPITDSMVNILSNLKIPFHVAAGSHIGLLQRQFFDPLYDYGFQGQFEAFVSNGAIHYHCDYSEEKSIKEISKFDIRKHLGEADYSFLIETLKKTLEIPEFKLVPPLKVIGETVTYRVSMVNFSPIGRVKEEGPEVRRNRKNFVEFDIVNGFRLKVMEHLENELELLYKNKNLRITLGGQTSFDIGVLSQDKSKAVRTLLDTGVDKLVFIGDALFEGGNDAAIREYIDDMPPNSPTKAEYFEVGSYEETIEKLHELDFIEQ